MSLFAFFPVLLTFVVIAGFTINRLSAPVAGGSALRGKSRGIAYAGIFLTAGYFTIIPPVYAAIDSFMPIGNGAELVSKYFVLTAIALLGGHLSLAYGSHRARRWIAGRQGLVVFFLVIVGLLWTLLITDAPVPSPELTAYYDQASVKVHLAIVAAYVAYVLLPLVVPSFKDSQVNPLKIGRISSGLICAGFSLSIARFVLLPVELSTNGEAARFFELFSHTSAICVILGLAGFAHARRKRIAQESLTSSLSLR